MGVCVCGESTDGEGRRVAEEVCVHVCGSLAIFRFAPPQPQPQSQSQSPCLLACLPLVKISPALPCPALPFLPIPYASMHA